MSLKGCGTDWNGELLRVTRQVFLVAGMVAACGVAGAQQNVPDAQVEANVLKALATAQELANQQITTKTVYGTVTLSGSVTDEHARTTAENLAANAPGVKKVVDELQLGGATAQSSQPMMPADQTGSAAGAAAPSGMVLLSDGTYGPAPAGTDQANGQPAPGSAPAEMAQRNNPEADAALDQQMDQQAKQAAGVTDQTAPQQQATSQQPGYPQAQPGYPQAGPQYPQSQQTYPQGQGYPQGQQPQVAGNGQPYPPAYPQYPQGSGQYPAPYPQYPNQYPNQYPRPMTPGYSQQPPTGYPQGQPPMGGQAAGQPVTIPAGAMLRVRINKTLSSNRTPAGTTFDGVVMNDVTANGLVAIPRGAQVQGKVVDAKSSGALAGRGEMSIQLTQVTMGGRSYPLNTDLWAHNGGDKTIETVNKTAGLGALGAIVGAVAGGGKGAAIGGGVGAAAGLGSSAASGNGQVFIPAEAIVTFHTTGENQVATVSEQEMQRLAYAAGPGGGDQPPVRRVYRVYPGYYPPPGYYPYPAYGYPNQ